MPDKPRFATLAVHGAKSFKGTSGPVAPSIVQTSTFVLPDSEAVEGYTLRGERSHYLYARYGNPLQDELDACLALLDGAEKALTVASGMAAITTAVLCAVPRGSRIVTISSLYGGTLKFFRNHLADYGIAVKEVSLDQLYDLRAHVDGRTRLIYFESPTNPNLKIVDIARVVSQARALGIPTMMDNTFASPVNQRPIAMGVDMIVQSATKYLGGHHDLLAGVITGPAAFIENCNQHMRTFGATIDPFAAFLLLRSLRTLDVRVKRHNENAMALARFLQEHPKVKAVHYPGLPQSPDHDVARGQMSGFGGMVTIETVGGKREAMRVADELALGINATSLGGVHTLVSLPVITSHTSLDDAQLAAAGVTPAMIRISVGLEDPQDLIADFAQALEKI